MGNERSKFAYLGNSDENAGSAQPALQKTKPLTYLSQLAGLQNTYSEYKKPESVPSRRDFEKTLHSQMPSSEFMKIVEECKAEVDAQIARGEAYIEPDESMLQDNSYMLEQKKYDVQPMKQKRNNKRTRSKSDDPRLRTNKERFDRTSLKVLRSVS